MYFVDSVIMIRSEEADSPDDTPVEAKEWRSVVVHIFKDKDDIQSYSNWRDIQLIRHVMRKSSGS